MYKDLLVIMGLCIVVASAFAAEDSPAAGALLYGGDISMLPRFEELGAVYRDNGKPADATRIMIHIDPGGSATKTTWFFRNIEKCEVEYDLIGLSYYPWWHGSIAALRNNLQKTAEAFGKGIVVVETAYPWRKDTEGKNMAWPQTPQEQKQFLEDVIQAVRSTPHGIGKGVLWWHPESIPIKGLEVWKGGNAALFDADAEGSALPALDAFQTE